jgi:transcriptional regulator GlxA family with amidase domain
VEIRIQNKGTRDRVLALRRPLEVVLLGPPDARILDLAGPSEVFSRANEVLAEREPASKPGYKLKIVSIESSSRIDCFGGFRILTTGGFKSLEVNLDTILVAGGRATWDLPRNEKFIRWLRRASVKARRMAAIGSGAFLLAEAGLLQGKRVTTHWRWAQRLRKAYPSVVVDPSPIFIRDGKVYTSAGVSVSLDLCLAMVEEDYGHEIASEVARRLVIFVYRSGEQPQVSSALILQGADSDRLRDLGLWISNHLNRDLRVETLARKSAMSVRNFARRFRQAFGVAPAEFVLRVRVEAACRRMEETNLTLEQIASECGFSSAELLRRACHRTLGHAPSRFRQSSRGSEV